MEAEKSLTLIKSENMNVQKTKKTLHELIDRIEDNDLLTLYVKLFEREVKKMVSEEFFNTTESDLKARAEASLKSVREGRSRNIKLFKKDIESWKKRRTI